MATADVNPALQLLEAGRRALRIERDDLAVEHDRRLEPRGPFLQGIRDFRKLAGFFIAEARPEPHLLADFRDGPDAVVFRLIRELRIVEGRVRERRQHW